MKRFFILILISLMPSLMLVAANKDRYVVMVSLDGYRWDYSKFYDTPLMDRLAADGVESGLIPCFPSKTFPNHYSLATGLHPDHHGIIANSFLDRKNGVTFALSNGVTRDDPRFWKGEPIWLTAKRQGVKTAVFYWPGSDVAIQGEYPDLYHKYNVEKRLNLAERVDGIIKVMNAPEAERPHLVMAYMEEPDASGHAYGPQDKKTRKAVQYVDSLLNVLYDNLMSLPYASKIDFLVVSDHGMAFVTPERIVTIRDKLKPEWIEAIEGDMPANIYCRPQCADKVVAALKDVQHIRVWKKNEVPAMYHYGTNEYCGDVIVSPDLGFVFTDNVSGKAGGMHGFDPNYNDMHALFRAVGPDFKHANHPHFPNTAIYPLVCHLLGITPAPNDGTLDDVKDIIWLEANI